MGICGLLYRIRGARGGQLVLDTAAPYNGA